MKRERLSVVKFNALYHRMDAEVGKRSLEKNKVKKRHTGKDKKYQVEVYQKKKV